MDCVLNKPLVMAVATPSKYTSTGGEDALKKYATYIVLSIIELY